MYKTLEDYFYRFEIKKGFLKERTLIKTLEKDFEDMLTLDAVITARYQGGNIYPLMTLRLEDNSVINYELEKGILIFNLVNWIKDNYPNAKITDAIRKYQNIK